jgi:hypothetical protein
MSLALMVRREFLLWRWLGRMRGKFLVNHKWSEHLWFSVFGFQLPSA